MKRTIGEFDFWILLWFVTSRNRIKFNRLIGVILIHFSLSYLKRNQLAHWCWTTTFMFAAKTSNSTYIIYYSRQNYRTKHGYYYLLYFFFISILQFVFSYTCYIFNRLSSSITMSFAVTDETFSRRKLIKKKSTEIAYSQHMTYILIIHFSFLFV